MRLTVAGLRSDRGKVRVGVFNEPASWLKKAAASQVLDIEGRRAEGLLEHLPFGEYGLAVYHDENGNGKLDRNFVGMPREPYGFSNNARRAVGAPAWEKARFTVASASVQTEVTVK